MMRFHDFDIGGRQDGRGQFQQTGHRGHTDAEIGRHEERNRGGGGVERLLMFVRQSGHAAEIGHAGRSHGVEVCRNSGRL
ncbi:MAG: hypothetical protein R2839_06745 [Thermomicrobiales bacterium]